jgi:peptide/nickel transport system substrate-binding protein
MYRTFGGREPIMGKDRRVGLLGVALALVVLSCAPAPRAAPAGGGQAATANSASVAAPKAITAAFLSDPPTLMNRVNSAVAGGRTSAGISELADIVNSSMTVVAERGAVEPRLAEAVPTLENGLWRVLPDGRTETTYRIKSGAQWHDGTPLTAADLAFTVQVAQDRELPFVRVLAYDMVEAIEVVDPRTALVKWKRPFIEADLLFAGAELVPKHVLERPYLDDPANFAYLLYWSTEYVGLGPFKVREFVRSSHLAMEANERYVLGRPRLDSIEIKFIPDSNTLSANILADAVQLTIGQTFSLETGLAVAEQWRGGRMEVSSASAGNPMHIFPQFINPSPAVIGDVRFRRALYHAIDRQEIVDSTMAGKAVLADGILWDPNDREWPGIESSIVHYPFDPRRATQLIDELGYTRGPDGFHREANGQRLTVELRTLVSFDTGVKIIFPIADYWQRAGVGVDPLVVPVQRQSDREYRAARPGFDLARSPRDLSRHHSDEIALPENRFTGANRARYGNTELDAAIDRYYVTIPWPERMMVLSRAVRHMTDQVTVMGIFFDVTPAMAANRVINIKAGRMGTDPINAHEWDLRAQ